MIVKTHEARPPQDKFQRTGDEAEKQMAFYLKRAFGDDPDVHVFHNLRFEHGSEAAQIDHLVFHRSGFIIVESKSVTSAVRVNEREEWSRRWDGAWKGMPSPVLQARRQAELLRAFLQAHKEGLRSKIMLGLKRGSFKMFMIDVVVAISDQGVIEHRGALPDVRKADQVSDRVKALIADHVQLARPFSRDKRADTWGFTLPNEDFVRTSAFLRAKHQDKDAEQEAPAPRMDRPGGGEGAAHLPEPRHLLQEVPAAFACRQCQGTALEIAFARSYYFKCKSCEGNTPIRLMCATCQGQQRTRKSSKEFFAECAGCGTSKRYFVNA